MIPLWITTGMMTSFSFPGLPSAFSLRMSLASFALEVCAAPRVLMRVVVRLKAEKMVANRDAKIRRVRLEFIPMLLSIRLRDRGHRDDRPLAPQCVVIADAVIP